MSVIGLLLVYGMLIVAVIATVVCAGTLLVYIGETVQDKVIEPWRTRHVRRHLVDVQRVPRRDLRHLPH
jgi:uncharacterized membrane protein